MRGFWLGCGMIWTCLLGLIAPAAAQERPNLILFVTDDHRWDALGCAGHWNIQTPHIDGLAQTGTRFVNTFCTTSICAVSRASLLTGQYARRHGVHNFATGLTAEQRAQTYPALLRKQGYWTGVVGKWGIADNLPLPKELFDDFRAFSGQGRYYPKGQQGQGEHLTQQLGQQALGFLQDRPRDKPFLLVVLFKAPHSQDGEVPQFPIDPRHKTLYEQDFIPLPKTGTAEHFAALPQFLQDSEARVRWKLRFTPELFQETVKDYFRLLTGVDEVVGEVLQGVHKQGLAEQTVTLFTADNGFYLGEHGLAGKWFMHEESIRLPLIVHDPRLPKSFRGQVLPQMALNIDIAPTLLGLAGVAPPDSMQGRNLQPLLHGARIGWREDFFYEHLFQHPRIAASEGVRTTRWKYIRYVTQEPVVEELYDLESDPYEERNLVTDEAAQPHLQQLRARWEALRAEVQ